MVDDYSFSIVVSSNRHQKSITLTDYAFVSIEVSLLYRN